MARVLLVEDDKTLAEMVHDWLKLEQYQIDVVHTGGDGQQYLKMYLYDIVILDWDLPQVSGLEICKSLRASGAAMPVLMLTGKDGVADKEAGLDSGADDYLTKPFHMKELSARLRALLRRPTGPRSNVLSSGNVQLDTIKHSATMGGAELELLPKEFALLEFLMRHPNQVFSIEALLNHVWEPGSDASLEAAKSCIKRLRRKLESENGECILQNVHGVGYKLQT